MRGEQGGGGPGVELVAGSPPRARGAVKLDVYQLAAHRITPACAGSREGRRDRTSAGPDHPRVRGEQLRVTNTDEEAEGSPPRARGAGLARVQAELDKGITPACAGSRRAPRRAPRTPADHPRVRGEQPTNSRYAIRCAGSPPRARGAAIVGDVQPAVSRITPACAGSRIDIGSGNSDFVGSPPRARGAGCPAPGPA